MLSHLRGDFRIDAQIVMKFWTKKKLRAPPSDRPVTGLRLNVHFIQWSRQSACGFFRLAGFRPMREMKFVSFLPNYYSNEIFLTVAGFVVFLIFFLWYEIVPIFASGNGPAQKRRNKRAIRPDDESDSHAAMLLVITERYEGSYSPRFNERSEMA